MRLCSIVTRGRASSSSGTASVKSGESGFTIVELMMTASLVALVISGSISLYIMTSRAWQHSQDRNDHVARVSIFDVTLRSEIRQAAKATDQDPVDYRNDSVFIVNPISSTPSSWQGNDLGIFVDLNSDGSQELVIYRAVLLEEKEGGIKSFELQRQVVPRDEKTPDTYPWHYTYYTTESGQFEYSVNNWIVALPLIESTSHVFAVNKVDANDETNQRRKLQASFSAVPPSGGFNLDVNTIAMSRSK